MEHLVRFSSRDVLAASVAGIGGTELEFLDVSEGGGSFQMQVSFSIPHPPDAGLMLGITAVGDHAPAEVAAQESACVAALRVLQDEHDYIVLDYSLFRIWECKERFTAFVEKLQHGRETLANVLSQSVEAFSRIQSTFQLFGRNIDRLRASDDGGSIRNIVAACASQLEIIYAQAMQGHSARAEQVDEINDPGDLNALLVAAGFHVPENQVGLIRLDGGLEAIFSSTVNILGYHPPEFGMRTEGNRFKCYIKFVSSGTGEGRGFTGFGKITHDAVSARQAALYSCLLALSVNQNVVILDPNRNGYLFSMERVDEIGADLRVLGHLGSSTCSSIQETVRIVNELTYAYSPLLGSHSTGQRLVQRLHILSSKLALCLRTIAPLVRSLNEEAFVGQLRY